MEKKQKTMQFTAQDLAAIARIKELYGCVSDMAAARLALQIVARHEQTHPLPLKRRVLRSGLIKLDVPRPTGSDIHSYPEAAHYRRVLSHFATGVTVITSSYRGQPVGFTVNSFCSVSLDPMLVSFCASNSSGTWPLIKEAGAFCVNILSENQREVCATFTRKGADRFLQTSYRLSASGMPVIDGVLAWIECSIGTVLPAGDHMIVLGQVHNLECAADGNPLVWNKGKFGTFRETVQIPAGERYLP